MASTTTDDAGGGVRFIREDDGTITAFNVETGLAAGGDTRPGALGNLAEVLTLHEGGGEEIEDERAFLEEIGIDSDELPNGSLPLPEFMR